MSDFWKPYQQQQPTLSSSRQQQQQHNQRKRQRYHDDEQENETTTTISYRRLRQHLEDDDNGPSSRSNHHDASFTSIQQQRMLLPIYKHRKQIIYAVEHYGIVMIIGETGCGKSTQIPQYLTEYGDWCSNDFQIACIQHHAASCISLTQRVQYETSNSREPVQQILVGYTIPWDYDTTISYMTQIKYITDDMIIREALLYDPLLSKYSVIIIDDIHERYMQTDMLCGIIKKIRIKRPQLRIILCSATSHNTDAIMKYFTNTTTSTEHKQQPPDDHDFYHPHHSTIISVDGLKYPVDILHAHKPISNYLETMIEVAYHIHHTSPNHDSGGGGDILCFLPTTERIDEAIHMAEEHFYHNNNNNNDATASDRYNVDIIPLYGYIPYQQQKKMWDQEGEGNRKKKRKRKIIFSTSIAETSITIPSITYVIDCGLYQLSYYDPITQLERNMISPVSQECAKQRCERAGRMVPGGVCYRLYTELYYQKEMTMFTPPEMIRTNITHMILLFKSLGVNHIFTFDMIDIPSVDSFIHGLETLYALQAIDEETEMTTLGINMSFIPAEPRIAKMIWQSIELQCTWEILTLASILLMPRSIFIIPQQQKHKKTQKDYEYSELLSNIIDNSGDHVTYINILLEMDTYQYNAKECYENFRIHYDTIRRCIQIRNSLAKFMKKQFHLPKISSITTATMTSHNKVPRKSTGTTSSAELIRSQTIRQCILYGYFSNIAKLHHDGRYYTIRKHIAVTPCSSSMIHYNSNHTSSLTKELYRSRYFDDDRLNHDDDDYHRSEYIMFHESMDSHRGNNAIEIKHVSYVEAKWLQHIAPHYWESSTHDEK